MNILPIFCDVNDFCLLFEPRWPQRLLQSGAARRNKPSALALSEVMTILILFHVSGYRDLKTFYTQYVQKHLGGAFPRLVSYNRFVELQRGALIPLWSYLQTRKGSCTGVAFVDATTLAVCHNLRIPQHKVFWDCAKHGQSFVPADRPKCFLNRDNNDFYEPEILDELRKQGCKLITNFSDGLGYIENRI